MSQALVAAAVVAGVNKTTLLRAIKAGEVSGNKDEHGQWHVAPQLHRVHPPVTQRAGTEAPHYHATAALEARLPACVESGRSCAASSKRPAKTATAGRKRRL